MIHLVISSFLLFFGLLHYIFYFLSVMNSAFAFVSGFFFSKSKAFFKSMFWCFSFVSSEFGIYIALWYIHTCLNGVVEWGVII